MIYCNYRLSFELPEFKQFLLDTAALLLAPVEGWGDKTLIQAIKQ